MIKLFNREKVSVYDELVRVAAKLARRNKNGIYSLFGMRIDGRFITLEGDKEEIKDKDTIKALEPYDYKYLIFYIDDNGIDRNDFLHSLEKKQKRKKNKRKEEYIMENKETNILGVVSSLGLTLFALYVTIARPFSISFWIIVTLGLIGVMMSTKKSFVDVLAVISALILVFVFTVTLIGSLRLKRNSEVITPPTRIETKDLDGKEISMAYADKHTALEIAKENMSRLMEDANAYRIKQNSFNKIINNGKLTRVAPLDHRSKIKDFTQRDVGIPYYIKVDVSSPSGRPAVELVKTEKPIKYELHGWFKYNLQRHVRKQYPTARIMSVSFEIDDEDNPFWTVTLGSPTHTLFSGVVEEKVLTVDPYDGKTEEYTIEDAPKWIDIVRQPENALQKLDNHYDGKNGFFGRIFGNKSGLMDVDYSGGKYNYVAIDGEMYVTTGVKPLVSDNEFASMGVLFVRTRDMDTYFYNEPGIDVPKAVKQIKKETDYKVANPTLTVKDGIPTYVSPLKDSAGIVRGYGLVNYNNYLITGTGSTLNRAESAYLSRLASKDFSEDSGTEVTIKNIVPINKEGTTYYYIEFEEMDAVYTVEITEGSRVPFFKVGDKVESRVGSSGLLEFD